MQSPNPDTDSAALPAEVVSMSIESQSQTPRRRSYPAITHFTIVAGVILPVAFLPYLLARRQIRHLRKAVDSLRETNVSLIQDLNQIKVQRSADRDSLRRLRGIVEEDLVRRLKELQKAAEQKDLASAKAFNGLKSDIRHVRELTIVQNATFGRLGSSLADVAAFMQEVNIRHGTSDPEKDTKIEAMRALALAIYNITPNPSNREETGPFPRPGKSSKSVPG